MVWLDSMLARKWRILESATSRNGSEVRAGSRLLGDASRSVDGSENLTSLRF